VGGIVLHKILSEKSLAYWSKLKSVYFKDSYSAIYTAISKYYTKHNSLPSFDELQLISRDPITKANVIALSNLKVPEEIDVSVAIEALMNDYVQTETLQRLASLLDKIQILDATEIKEELGNLVFYLDEKTYDAEEVSSVCEFSLSSNEELGDKVYLGINNSFDAATGGVSATELIMFGGNRGSGKSILSANIAVNQYLAGNTCVYFSIEMRAKEVHERIFSMLSGVPHSHIRKNTLSPQEYLKLAKVKADMFVNGSQYFEQFVKDGDFATFESSLSKEGEPKPNQIIVIDNPTLTMMDIDVTYQKYKSKYPDTFKVAVVDYLNQISIADIYDWKSQIMLSKGLKNLSRKYNVVTVTPYQTDKTGEARIAKGILDAADLAITLEAGKDFLKLKTTKSRSTSAASFASVIDWETLRITGEDAVITSDEEAPEEEDVQEKKKTSKPFSGKKKIPDSADTAGIPF
jgi:KaiC/GvpD/RAD55 family RecA-like ATPase